MGLGPPSGGGGRRSSGLGNWGNYCPRINFEGESRGFRAANDKKKGGIGTP